MKKIIIISLIIIAGLAVALFFGMPGSKASRIVLENGDLYSVSETLGAKKFTDLKDIKFIFDEKYDLILYGRGWQEAFPATVITGGTELWIRKLNSKQDQKIVEEKVTYALLNPQATTVYYTDEYQNLFAVNIDGSNKQKIMEKVLSPDLSRDGRYLVYQKLNPDWQAGDYYDNALGLTILDLKTKEEKRVSNTCDDWAQIWTPDGRKILFDSRNSEGSASFFIMNADGSNRIQLTNLDPNKITPNPSEKPIWSSDGKHLIYESDRAIWHLEFDEAQSKIINSETIGAGMNPQWIEDGKSITTIIKEGETRSINIINL